MVLEKIFEEVSNLLIHSGELCKHTTTSEPHDALVKETHPKTEIDDCFKKNSFISIF
jgi:hypothetical protein